MLVFLPPVVQILAGAGLLAAGVAVHSVILDVLGCLGLIIGGSRWLRRRSGGAGGTGGGAGGSGNAGGAGWGGR